MMGKLVRLELKKIGWLKTVVVLAVLTLPLIYLYFYVMGGTAIYKVMEPEHKYYNSIRGEVTQEMYDSIATKLDELKKHGGESAGFNEEDSGSDPEIMGDYSGYGGEQGIYGETLGDDMAYMNEALLDCKKFLQIKKSGQIMAENAKRNLEVIDKSDTFNVRYNEMILKRAENFSELKMMNRNNQYSTYFLAKDYVLYLFSALVILLCSIFTKDKESGMTALLRSTKEGRRKLFGAKYIAMLVVSAGVTLYFQIINFLGLCVSYGLQPEELGYSIRQISGYEGSLYDYSIIQFIVMITLMRMLAVIFVGTVVMMISMLSKNTIVSAGVSALAAALLVGVPYYIDNILIGESFTLFQLGEKLKNYVCTWMLFAGKYFTKLSVVNVFGYPVPNALFITMISVLSCIVAALIACRIYCGKICKRKRRTVA